jgi:hypothetical protein
MKNNKSHDHQKGKGLINMILNKIKINPLNGHKRPPYLPPFVPDCGWNHGEENEKNNT